MTATIPALPASISHMMIRRLTGWRTTLSDSVVVNPAPLKAERAWKRAASRDMPVAVSATVAARVTTSERVSTIMSVRMAATRTRYPNLLTAGR